MKNYIFRTLFVFIFLGVHHGFSQSSLQVTAIQYFYDNDPGVGIAGNGGIITVTPAANVTQNFALPTPNVEGGFHYLFVRAKNENGVWGLAERKGVWIEPTSQSITAIQYFYDSDPGVDVAGNGGIIQVTPASSITQAFALTTPNIDAGFHFLFVRAKDNFGKWGLAERHGVWIERISQSVTALEYYFDSDPGIGNGMALTVTPSSNISTLFSIQVPCLTAGSHTLFVRAKNEFGKWGIISRSTVTINSGIAPAVVSPTGPINICQGNSSQLSTTMMTGMSYQWKLNGANISGATGNSYAATTSGNYSLVTTCNGNSATSNIVTVNVISLPTVTSGSNVSVCLGSSTQLNASGSGGSGFGYSFQWSPSTGLSNANIYNPTASPTSATTYSVTVTDGNGCSSSIPATTTVSVNSLPLPNIAGGLTFCSGSYTSLDAGIFNGYAWSTGATTQTISVNTGGNYNVTVTDGNGCTGSVSVNTIENPLPSVTVSNVSGCDGTPVSLTGSPSGGNWSVANPYSGPATTYTYTYTDGNGCTNTSNPATITWIPLPVVTADDVVGCTGMPVTLSGSPLGGTWSVANPYLGNSITYTHTYTDGNGCTNTSSPASISIYPAPPPPTVMGILNFCSGSSTSLMTGLYTSYLWSTGETTSAVSISAGGNYSVTVTDVHGCTAISNITVTENPLPLVTANDVFSCDGSQVNLTGFPTGGSWSVSNPYIGPTTTYTYTYTDGNGCTNTSAAANITIHPLPVVSASNVSGCIGTPIPLVGSPSGGTFSIPSPYSGSNNSSYTYSYTDGNGCTGTSAAGTITVNPLPVVTASSNSPVIQGATLNLTAGGTGVSYSWTGPPPFQSLLQNPSIPNATSSNQGTYTVTGTDANGCSASASTSVTINNCPSATLSATTCNAGPLTVSSTGTNQYINWTLNGTTIQSPAYKYNQNGLVINGLMPVKPKSIFLDNNFGLYVVDSVSNTVVKFTMGVNGGIGSGSGQVVASLASTSFSNYSIRGIFVDIPGALYLAVTNFSSIGGRILKFTSGGMTVVSPAIGSAEDVAVDLGGTMYIADKLNGVIFKCQQGAATATVIANIPSPMSCKIITGINNPAIYVNSGNGKIYKVTQPSNAVSTLLTGINARYICVENNGNVYYSYGAGTIGRYIVSSNNQSSIVSVPNCQGIAMNPGAGYLYVGNDFANTVIQYERLWNTITPLTGGTYAATVNSSGGCLASTNSILISPAPPVPGTISGIANPCPNTNGVTYSIAAVTGASSYNWTAPAGAVFTANGQSTYSTSALSVSVDYGSSFTTGSLTVSAANSCTSSTARSLSVGVAIPARPSITGPVTEVCNTIPYTCTNTGAASYSWSVSPSAGVSIFGNGSTIVSIQFPTGFNGGTISVAALNACGVASLVRSIAVTTLPGTVNYPSGSTYGVCNMTNLTYSISSVVGASQYYWSASTGANINGKGLKDTTSSNSSSISFTPAFGTGNICIQAHNACGTVPSSPKCLSVKSVPPAPTSITGPSTVCANQTGVAYSIAQVASATSYLWTIPTGTTLGSGQGTTNLTVNFGNSLASNAVIKVLASNACGNGGYKSQTVSITCREGENMPESNSLLIPFPNPVSKELNVRFALANNTPYRISLVDALGNIVSYKNGIAAIENQITLDVSQLAKGLYQLHFNSEEHFEIHKIIVE